MEKWWCYHRWAGNQAWVCRKDSYDFWPWYCPQASVSGFRFLVMTAMRSGDSSEVYLGRIRCSTPCLRDEGGVGVENGAAVDWTGRICKVEIVGRLCSSPLTETLSVVGEAKARGSVRDTHGRCVRSSQFLSALPDQHRIPRAFTISSPTR